MRGVEEQKITRVEDKGGWIIIRVPFEQMHIYRRGLRREVKHLPHSPVISAGVKNKVSGDLSVCVNKL